MYDLKQQLRELQAEVDRAFLHQHFARLAKGEPSAQEFRQLSAFERSQAEKLLLALKKMHSPPPKMPTPSLRARLLAALAQVVGYQRVLRFSGGRRGGVRQ